MRRFLCLSSDVTDEEKKDMETAGVAGEEEKDVASASMTEEEEKAITAGKEYE